MSDSNPYDQIAKLRSRVRQLEMALRHCDLVASIYGDGTLEFVSTANTGFKEIKEVSKKALTQ